MNDSLSTDVQYETRFAIVMYGGISLAIYICGVTQEFYSMVRATAEDHGEGPLSETEKVYRDLGKYLHTKFVVDILSGTSAGGLNAIFLAKALANNQDFSKTANLWKEVADVETLIYDDKSVRDLPVRLQVPDLPEYLMNSQRMTYLLLKAFKDMGGDAKKASHFARELDLYVTATDFYGRNINLPTSDPETLQAEKKYRKVFHLRYSGRDANDFVEKNNPFLAFISRCTSAIPPAFETMTLKDAQAIPNLKISDEQLASQWKTFFDDTDDGSFVNRPYADGGYLDNKPFTYATNSLLNRTADVPVDRKLFYIDPSPEHFSYESSFGKKPNVIENVSGALIGLPRYETIREDLEALHQRNDLIERVGRTLDVVESQFLKIPPTDMPTISKYDWTTFSLNDCIRKMGPSYGAYLSLRMNGLVEKFETDIVNQYHAARHSSGFMMVKKKVRQWFDENYPPDKTGKTKGEKTWTKFLYTCDFDWRVRRLNFLQQKIDQLLLLESIINLNDEDLQNFSKEARYTFLLKSLDVDMTALKKEGNDANTVRNFFIAQMYGLFTQSFGKRQADVKDEIGHWEKWKKRKRATEKKKYLLQVEKWLRYNPIVKKSPDDVPSGFREVALAKESGLVDALRDIKKEINELQKKFNDIHAKVSSEIGPGGLTPNLLKNINMDGLEEEKKDRVEKTATEEIRRYIPMFVERAESYIRQERQQSSGILGLETEVFTEYHARELVQCYLQTFYEAYEYFDKLTYPLVVSNGLGEADVVDVWRISPEESSLVKTQKLGGQTLGHFGAFFKKEWRENDIMWGRLDGAEQIIRSLGLPKKQQDDFIRRAQSAILRDEAKNNNQKLLDTLKPANDPDPAIDIAQPNDILAVFKKNFKINLALETQSALKLTARSSQVAGKIFEGLSLEYSVKNSLARWLTRMGQLLFWIVEMASTGSWLSIIARNIFVLLYFVGFFMVAVGSLSTTGGIADGLAPISKLTTFGWGTIGFTAFLQYARYIFSQILQKRAFIDLRKLPEQPHRQEEQNEPIQFFLPYVLLVAAGVLLIWISFNTEKLIGLLTATKEILWLAGLALGILGLLIYLVSKAGTYVRSVLGDQKKSWLIAFILFAVTAVSALCMIWTIAPLKAAGYGILDLERADVAQKTEILQAWVGMEKYLWWTLSIDFVFLIGLSAFLWFVWSKYARKIAEIQGQSNLERFSRLMAVFAVMGGIFDALENASIMGILAGYSIDVLGSIAWAATSLKFIFFALPVLFWPFVGVWVWGAWVQKKLEDARRPV